MKVAAERGDPVPPSLVNRPSVWPHLREFWAAFDTLSSARPLGYNAPNPIALSEINAYCDLAEIKDQEQKADLLYFVQALDAVWMREWVKKAKAKK